VVADCLSRGLFKIVLTKCTHLKIKQHLPPQDAMGAAQL
jgi:hypothetical protein